MTHYLIIYLLPSLRDGKSDFEQRKSREQPLCGEESLRLLTPKSPEGDFAVDFIAVGNSFTVRILCKGSVGSGCTGMNSRVDPKGLLAMTGCTMELFLQPLVTASGLVGVISLF